MSLLKRLFLLVFLLFPLAAIAQSPKAGYNDGKLKWHTLGQGLEAARASGKPVMAVVQTSWCPACKEYRLRFFDERVVQMSDRFVLVMIDQDKDPALAAKLNIDGDYVPRTLFLTSDARIMTKIAAGDPAFRYFVPPETATPLLRLMHQASR